jgi:hypothetical protein
VEVSTGNSQTHFDDDFGAVACKICAVPVATWACRLALNWLGGESIIDVAPPAIWLPNHLDALPAMVGQMATNELSPVRANKSNPSTSYSWRPRHVIVVGRPNRGSVETPRASHLARAEA